MKMAGDRIELFRGPRLRRRTVVGGLLSLGVTAALPAPSRAQTAEAIVETTHGKLRGTSVDGVQVFKGIPYAASTAGSNRFLPPQALEPWTGVRDALQVGQSAPQVEHPPSRIIEWYGKIEPISENCLFLNVFAQGASHGTRKPIMVWLHGGGWVESSGTAPGFDGIELVKQGQVVLVTINHRLNLFGYFKFDDNDARFADSGNAGVLDMVAALRWVRENAAAFGGDPNNVTIFGQSGGGSKVSALMAAPAAKGLFHKAIAQSCSGSLRITGEDEAAEMAHGLATRLGLPRAGGAALQAASMDRLIAAMTAEPRAFRPVLDGRTFTRHPFDPDAPSISTNVPFMAGNAANETRFILARNLKDFSLDADDVGRRLARFLKIDASETDRILNAYRAADPTATPSDLLAAVTTDYMYIRNTRREALLKSAAPRAPAYVYVFNWRTPVMDGLLRSPHAVEVPFIFGTTSIAGGMVGSGPDLVPLTKVMIATWSTFAHTGNPNNSSIPHWPRYDAKERAVMALNLSSKVERDPGGQTRALLDHLPFYEYNHRADFA
jgi:para-nitrobenzyl esterase